MGSKARIFDEFMSDAARDTQYKSPSAFMAVTDKSAISGSSLAVSERRGNSMCCATVRLLVARVRGKAADRGDHADVTPRASRMLGSAFGGLNE